MPTVHRARTVLARAVLLLAAACGGGADEEAGDSVATLQTDPGATSSVAAAPAGATDAPLTVDDIDRWQRGMAAELQAVREAGARLARATSGADSVSAIFDANDMATRAAGARAAGVDEERYRHIASRFSGIVLYLVPLSSEVDVSQMPAEMQKQMQDGRDAALARESERMPPVVLEALRPRAAELRRQELELVGERLKAAGIGG